MANLGTPLRIGRGNGNVGWMTAQQIYHFSTTSGMAYVHFKTNVSVATEKIFMIEAEGYAYGGGAPILCAWGLYTTGATPISMGSVVAKGLESKSGLTAHGVYASSDGYACIRSYGNMYYTGFVLHAYSHYYFTPSSIAITAVNQNENSGNYY